MVIYYPLVVKRTNEAQKIEYLTKNVKEIEKIKKVEKNMLTFSSEFDILYKQPQEVVAKMIIEN